MREIKFRLFDKWQNRMYEWREFRLKSSLEGGWTVYLNDESNAIPRERYVLLQFTGGYDKNRNEIYEGDLVRGKYWFNKQGKKGSYRKVVFKHGAFRYVKGRRSRALSVVCFHWREIEVVGNIFQNIELMNSAG